MVFFTCNHCGASVKKNKVEKHYGTQCKNFPSLSCMDCQKDFQGSEYEKHTKCITEDEKYSAKGFVPKPTSNKGEVKQQSWLEVIRSVKNSNHRFSQSEKSILDTIVNHENVPRKKNKFLNFLKSTFNNRYDPTAADNIWKMLEEQNQKSNGNEKQANEKLENGTTEAVPNVCSADSDKTESGIADKSTELLDDSISTKQKKKKSKKNSESENGSNLGPSGEEVANETIEAVENCGHEVRSDSVTTKQKKKKSKKNRDSEKGNNFEDNAEVANQSARDLEDGNTIDQSIGSTKKKKSKKNSDIGSGNNLEHNGEEMANQSPDLVENITDSVSTEQKKKESKKSSESEKENSLEHNGIDISNEPTETVVNGNTLSKKERKQKRKREKYEATLKEIELQQPSEVEPVSEESPKKKKKKSKNDESENVVVAESKPSKKEKKRIAENVADEPHSKKLKEEENHENGEESHPAPSQEKGDQSKFNWNRTIVELIQAKGGEMPLKRLRKKIIAEYQNCTGSSENQEAVTVKFNKKLMKVPGIAVNKEIVQLLN